MKALYIGQHVTVNVGGRVRTGEVIDLGDKEFCIEWTEGGTEWIKNSTVVKTVVKK